MHAAALPIAHYFASNHAAGLGAITSTWTDWSIEMITQALRSGDIERVLNRVGYSHGRHEDQAQRVRDFGKIVRGTNFLTPRRAGLYRLKAKPYVIVEVALGEGLDGGPMIGVTVADCAKQENCYDLSGAVFSLEELTAKFADLERGFS